MMCELCGKDTDLFQTEIEDTMLNLCGDCNKHGKVIKRIHIPSGNEMKHMAKEAARKAAEPPQTLHKVAKKKSLMIREDIAVSIKNAREKLGLKQEELAKKLAVKESLIHHLESGKFEPRIDMARRFERFLNITLVEEVEEQDVLIPKVPGEGVTVGDLISIKKRKR